MSNQLPKQPLSVYTVMLILSAILMTAACVLMSIELIRYGGNPWEDPKIPNAPGMIMPLITSFRL